nr:hypothetical protein [Candidatus Pelagisphaera phototrophica]
MSGSRPEALQVGPAFLVDPMLLAFSVFVAHGKITWPAVAAIPDSLQFVWFLPKRFKQG